MDTVDQPLEATPGSAQGAGPAVDTVTSADPANDPVPRAARHPGGAGTAYEELTLRVNEIFGPTIQGEGPASGRHCLFLRLALCNLRCTWCDTAYTWAHTPELAAHLEQPKVYPVDENLTVMGVHDVLDALMAKWPLKDRPTTVVVSGGEPLMQQPALIVLAQHLAGMGCSVHVETAGTIAPLPALADLVELFVVSPKLDHSGNPEGKRIRPAPLLHFRSLGHRAVFKFVARSVFDLSEIDGLVARFDIPACRVQVMPEGVTTAALAATGLDLVPAVVARGWGMSLRSHILLWGDKRGV